MREEIPTLDIARTYEFLGGTLPAHVKGFGWTPVRCLVHDGFSGSINISANRFHCFGCDEARGDGLDMIQQVEGVSLAQAIEIAGEQGLVIDAGPQRGPARKTQHRARPKRPERR